MSTEAQLKALSNSELASGIQIPALNHRTVNNAIIEEMYDAQSRGDVLSGVQSAGSLASGDKVFVIRSGQAYLLDASNLDFVSALSDLTDVSITSLSNDQILVYDTSVSRWVNKFIDEIIIGGTITGTGSVNTIPKFTDLKEIGDSSITDDGTTVTVDAVLRTAQIEGVSVAAQNQKIFFTDDSIILQVGESPNLTIGAGGQFIVATGAGFNGTVTAGSFVTNGGTSSEFVKGDGSLDGTTYQDTSEKGQANGYAPLDSGAKVAEAYLPDSILGQVSYQGTWDASTNTPTLANPPASTTKGEYYVTSAGGTQFGIDFQVGDWAISNGSAWQKVDNTDAVTSVFGRLGNVVANAGDYDSFYVTLDTTQTITGEKTFSSDALRIAADGTANVLRFRNTSGSSVAGVGVNIIGMNGSNDLFLSKSTSNIGVFSFSNTAARTYTFPDTTGTVALTSDLDDTLDSVTDRGATTTNAITVGGATINGNLTVDTNTLFVDSANNRVGIGTSSPSQRLEVNGNIELSVSENTIQWQSGNGIIQAPSNLYIRTSSAGGNLLFQVNNDEKMRIDSSGNVGIGTQNPTGFSGRVLHIHDTSIPRLKLTNDTTGATNFDGFEILVSGNDSLLVNRESGNLTFSTNASERMRITSSGNVGIGTGSPYNNLTVEGASARMDLNNAGGASRKALLIEPLGYGGNAYARIESYDYGLGSGGDLVINSQGGNVGIGTTSPSAKITLSGTGTGSAIDWVNTTASTGRSYRWVSLNSGGFAIEDLTASGTERMRITSGGYFKASDTGVYRSSTGNWHELVQSNSEVLAFLEQKNTNPFGPRIEFNTDINNTSNYFLRCTGNGASRALIYSNGNLVNVNNSYGAISDIKLKENIEDANPKLDDLMKVKVRNYNWIGEKTKQIGVIAQELEGVFPSMIDESIDFEEQEVIDEEGNVTKERVDLGTTTKSVKYSVFVPILIKAIQEQQAIIEDLKARIQTLENS